MNRDELLKKLEDLGFLNREEYLAEALKRNIGLLTEREQQQIKHVTIAIPGMGGVGGLHLTTLVRVGFIRFRLADFDVFEPVNVNRQTGATVPNFGQEKLKVMKEIALSINPFLEIEEFPQGINESNLETFLDGVDIVVDGLDYFSFEMRHLLFTRAQEKGAYVITAGPMGFSSAVLVFAPGCNMTFDRYFNTNDSMPEEDKHLLYGLGLSPRPTHIKYMDLSRVDLSSKEGPSSAIACQLCAGMAAAECLKIALGRGTLKPVPHFSQFDPYLMKYRKGKLYMGNRNPIQRLKFRVVKYILNKKKKQPSNHPIVPVPIAGKLGTDTSLRFLVSAGIQAPSGDNCQPWNFRLKKDTILVYLDETADYSFFNVNQLASIISCGAVIENIRVAATKLGLLASVKYVPDRSDKSLMAQVKLSVAPVDPDPLYNVIWERCTNRKFYKKVPLLPSVVSGLEEAISGFDGVKLNLITDRKTLKKLGWLIYSVDRIRTEHRSLHEHLMQMIRFTKKEAEEKRNGFPLKNLEAGIAGEIFLRLTRPWWLMNLMNKMGVGRMVAFHSYKAITSSSAAVLLTVRGKDIEDFLKGGQALQRLWLTLTDRGVAMQPMTAITLFWLRWKIEGEENFLPGHRKLLRKVWKSYQNLFPNVDFSQESHIMLFRIGYGPPVSTRTFRKDIDQFLKGQD